MLLSSVVGTFAAFLVRLFNPSVLNKAGPDWLWMGGQDDVLRSLYFRPDGSFRRFGRIALLATLFAGSASLSWML